MRTRLPHSKPRFGIFVLKGFSHCPDFVPDPRFRAQYDIDLLFPLESVARARVVALKLEYQPSFHSVGIPSIICPPDSQDRLEMARRLLRSGDTAVPGAAFPIVGCRAPSVSSQKVWSSSGIGVKAGKWTGCALPPCIPRMRSATRPYTRFAMYCAAVRGRIISTNSPGCFSIRQTIRFLERLARAAPRFVTALESICFSLLIDGSIAASCCCTR